MVPVHVHIPYTFCVHPYLTKKDRLLKLYSPPRRKNSFIGHKETSLEWRKIELRAGRWKRLWNLS